MRCLSLFLAVVAALLVSGCSIKQTVTPVSLSAAVEPVICMIPAEGLRPGFQASYERLLRDKGFQVRQLAANSNPAVCPLSTTYIGRWSWDFTLYMSYADIRVFQHGVQIGQAEYDSRSGSMTFSKFINADAKIGELTQQLFPNGAVGVSAARL